jgi:hypothetical protein
MSSAFRRHNARLGLTLTFAHGPMISRVVEHDAANPRFRRSKAACRGGALSLLRDGLVRRLQIAQTIQLDWRQRSLVAGHWRE